MLIATIPLLVAIVGAFVFLAATNPKTAELGKLSFFAGSADLRPFGSGVPALLCGAPC